MLLPKGWRQSRRRGIDDAMGITNVEGSVHLPGAVGPRVPVTFLVDSGAIYSLLPAAVWGQLGLWARRDVDFSLADGTLVRAASPSARSKLPASRRRRPSSSVAPTKGRSSAR